jgi:ATP-binding cassette subfamily B protein
VSRALRLAWRASPEGFLSLTLISVVPATFPPITVWLSKRLVDLIALSYTAHATAQRTGVPVANPVTFRDAFPTVVALGLLAAGTRLFGAFQGTRYVLFDWRLRHDAERRFFEQAARVDLGHFDNSDWHDRVARAKRDVSWRPSRLVQTVQGLAGSVVTVLGMLGVLLVLHPLLVVLALLAVLPTVVVQRRLNRRLYDFWWVTTPEDREKAYMGQLLSEPRSSKEIRSFELRSHLIGRYQEIADQQHGILRTLYRTVERYLGVSGMVSGAFLAVAYGFVAAKGVTGELSPGSLTAMIGAFAAVAAQIGLISASLVEIDQHATFLDDYFTFLSIETLVPVPAHPTQLPATLREGVVFDDVTFTYPGGTEPALAGLSLAIEPGELIALVGDNGAGKTSLVKLLLRFYDPQKGSVRVGGVDLRQVDPEDLRNRIGILFQDFTNYELSARENVSLGDVRRQADDESVRTALESARALEIVKGLRDGLDSKVGRLFDGGHDLSGGEWQRLALARLIYRDADIWILDEPTSALDPEAEAGIFAELREQLEGRVGIVISHRFSTVRIADRIAVVGDGRVTELGTHEELIALGGRYAQLFELQAAGYR